MFKDRFKKFTGEHIPDIIEYLRDYINDDPGVTISVGCDSIQRRRRTVYAITIMLYNSDRRKGAHVVFFRESCPKIRENNDRLGREAKYVHDLGEYLDTELSNFYKRSDLTDVERKRYKYHLAKSGGEYSGVQLHNEDAVVNNLTLCESDLLDFKLVDIHVDFNPFESTTNKSGTSNNKSNVAYKIYTPWLRALGFRVWAKPCGTASTSAADLLLHD